MKKVQIQAVFLAFVIMMPLVVTSIIRMGDRKDMCELSENGKEEEQRDERETEGAEGKEGKDVEEYLFHNNANFVYTGNGNIEYFARSKKFISINTDVLTPPPELI